MKKILVNRMSRGKKRGKSPLIISTFFKGTGMQSKADASPFFQPALAFGQPNDKYEREADSIADKVSAGHTAMPVAQPQAISKVQKADLQVQQALQRQPEKEAMETVQMALEKEEEEAVQMQSEVEEEPIQAQAEEEAVQMQADVEEEEPIQAQQEGQEEALQAQTITGRRGGADFVGAQLSKGNGNGEALPALVREDMEASFGTSFEGVKIHRDSTAVQMNKAIGAKAFTHGNDIYFNNGCFAPNTHIGRHLLAHELTHVVQQTGSKNSSTIFPQRRGAAPIRRRTTDDLLKRLMAPDSPLWRQLNPHADSPINCPATAAAVDEFLTTGEVTPAPSGDGLSSFDFSLEGMSENIEEFNTIRRMLSRPNAYAVVRANRSAEFSRTNAMTRHHFFTAVNFEGSIIIVDAYRRGQIINDVDAFLELQGFESYNVFRGRFTVTHRSFDIDAVPEID